MGKPGQLKRPTLGEGALKQLNDALHDLHLRAGRPSLSSMANMIEGRWVSRSRLHDALTAPVLPQWEVVDALVEILASKARGTSPEQELDRFTVLWQSAVREPEDSHTLGELRSRSSRNLSSAIEQRHVVAIDVFGNGKRTLAQQKDVRHRLQEAVEGSLAGLQVNPSDTLQHDRGDGLLILFSPSVPSPYIVSMWVILFHEELRRVKAEELGLRLGIGMQKGSVDLTSAGMVGTTVNGAYSLAESDQTLRLLDDRGGRLVLGVSEAMYEGAVRGYRLAVPGEFTSAEVLSASGVTRAWFRLII